MGLGDRERYILELLDERGPMDDDSLSTEVVGDQGQASDIAPMTSKLDQDGLVEESGLAPRRWRITNAGRHALGR